MHSVVCTVAHFTQRTTWNIVIIIIIIINRQFLTRRDMEHHHPLQGRELSMYREIRWCLVMSVTIKQVLSLDLNEHSDWRFLMSGDSWFHAAGADTAKYRRIVIQWTKMGEHAGVYLGVAWDAHENMVVPVSPLKCICKRQKWCNLNVTRKAEAMKVWPFWFLVAQVPPTFIVGALVAPTMKAQTHPCQHGWSKSHDAEGWLSPTERTSVSFWPPLGTPVGQSR